MNYYVSDANGPNIYCNVRFAFYTVFVSSASKISHFGTKTVPLYNIYITNKKKHRLQCHSVLIVPIYLLWSACCLNSYISSAGCCVLNKIKIL